MNLIKIANKIIADYIYDPNHEEKPTGNYHKTEKGWSDVVKKKNLTDLQKTQTQSTQFKNWFNQSKIVDKNGEPLIVYHGTNRNINKFRKGSSGYLGSGMYFTSDKNRADHYARENYSNIVLPVYLKMENPLVLTSVDGTKELLNKIHGSDKQYEKRKKKQDFDTHIVTNGDINRLLKKGYDGIIWFAGGEVEFVVYTPNQIKHAENNNGKFSRFEDNIYS